jgi:hypothetical protein
MTTKFINEMGSCRAQFVKILIDGMTTAFQNGLNILNYVVDRTVF